MKKIFLLALITTIMPLCAMADDKADVMAIFDKYVNDANAYSQNIPSYYTNNAKIVRVVNKKQGGQPSADGHGTAHEIKTGVYTQFA